MYIIIIYHVTMFIYKVRTLYINMVIASPPYNENIIILSLSHVVLFQNIFIKT